MHMLLHCPAANDNSDRRRPACDETVELICIQRRDDRRGDRLSILMQRALRS